MKTAEWQQAESSTTLHRVAGAWERTGVPTRALWCAATMASAVIAVGLDAAPVLTWATGVLLATAALVDVVEHRLPNRLLVGGAIAAAVAASATGRLAAALSGAAIAGGLMLAVRLARGLGMGDVKMAAVIGASVAPRVVVAAPAAVAVAAFTAAVVGLVRGRTRLALGPSLWVGWAAVLAAPMGWLQ